MQPRARRTGHGLILVLSSVVVIIQIALDVVGRHRTFKNEGIAHPVEDRWLAAPGLDPAQVARLARADAGRVLPGAATIGPSVFARLLMTLIPAGWLALSLVADWAFNEPRRSMHSLLCLPLAIKTDQSRLFKTDDPFILDVNNLVSGH